MHAPDRRSMLWAIMTAPLAWLASGCGPETVRDQIFDKCSKCKGTGKVTVKCTYCNGTGAWGIGAAKNRCATCNGTGSYISVCFECVGSGRKA